MVVDLEAIDDETRKNIYFGDAGAFEITVINHGWDEMSRKNQNDAKRAGYGDEYETHTITIDKKGLVKSIEMDTSTRSDRLFINDDVTELSISDYWGYELVDIESLDN